LERLLELEERKRRTPVDDDAFPALAREVEEAARALVERAATQSALSEDAHVRAVGTNGGATIEQIPADLTPAAILALWRDAERELDRAQLDPVRRRALTQRAAALCAAYQAAYRRQS
jgi:hypothetical protein